MPRQMLMNDGNEPNINNCIHEVHKLAEIHYDIFSSNEIFLFGALKHRMNFKVFHTKDLMRNQEIVMITPFEMLKSSGISLSIEEENKMIGPIKCNNELNFEWDK